MATFPTTFDPSDLPGWARRNSAVIALCRRSHEFRCDVYRAETEQYRRHLARQAERQLEHEANR